MSGTESATFSEDLQDAREEEATGIMNPGEQSAGSQPNVGAPQAQHTFSTEQLQALLLAAQSQGGPMSQDRPPKEKLPKLAEFDGTREDWENWKMVAESKIRIDGAAIGSNMDQLDYVHSRLRKGAANMVRAFVKKKREEGNGSA